MNKASFIGLSPESSFNQDFNRSCRVPTLLQHYREKNFSFVLSNICSKNRCSQGGNTIKEI